jgi:hypothetical protein
MERLTGLQIQSTSLCDTRLEFVAVFDKILRAQRESYERPGAQRLKICTPGAPARSSKHKECNQRMLFRLLGQRKIFNCFLVSFSWFHLKLDYSDRGYIWSVNWLRSAEGVMINNLGSALAILSNLVAFYSKVSICFLVKFMENFWGLTMAYPLMMG